LADVAQEGRAVEAATEDRAAAQAQAELLLVQIPVVEQQFSQVLRDYRVHLDMDIQAEIILTLVPMLEPAEAAPAVAAEVAARVEPVTAVVVELALLLGSQLHMLAVVVVALEAQVLQGEAQVALAAAAEVDIMILRTTILSLLSTANLDSINEVAVAVAAADGHKIIPFLGLLIMKVDLVATVVLELLS